MICGLKVYCLILNYKFIKIGASLLALAKSIYYSSPKERSILSLPAIYPGVKQALKAVQKKGYLFPTRAIAKS